MPSTNYTKKAILEEVERELRETNLKLPTEVMSPLSSRYPPEVNSTAKLDPDKQNYYQGLIGVLSWICNARADRHTNLCIDVIEISDFCTHGTP